MVSRRGAISRAFAPRPRSLAADCGGDADLRLFSNSLRAQVDGELGRPPGDVFGMDIVEERVVELLVPRGDERPFRPSVRGRAGCWRGLGRLRVRAKPSSESIWCSND
jgi:hypothetical protein